MSITTSLSICITLLNRSKLPLGAGHVLELFPNCVDALRRSILPDEPVEVVISDWESTDWPLQDWLVQRMGHVQHRVVSPSGAFHRSIGRNVAAHYAQGEVLFFLDADVLISRDVLLRGLQAVQEGSVYYPKCFYFLDPQHSKGFWCAGARGLIFMSRKHFKQIGDWPAPPHYRSHVDEDQAYFKKVRESGIIDKHENVPGLFHQYHPGRSVDTILRKRKFLIEQTSALDIQPGNVSIQPPTK